MKCLTCAHIDCHASTCPDDPSKFCEWTPWEPDDMGTWDTACGNAHCFVDGGPTENEYKFCPYCGKKLIEVKPTDHVGEE